MGIAGTSAGYLAALIWFPLARAGLGAWGRLIAAGHPAVGQAVALAAAHPSPGVARWPREEWRKPLHA